MNPDFFNAREEQRKRDEALLRREAEALSRDPEMIATRDAAREDVKTRRVEEEEDVDLNETLQALRDLAKGLAIAHLTILVFVLIFFVVL